MQKWVYPIVRFKQCPPILGLSFGALLGLLLSAFAIGERAQQQSDQLFAEFGTALVNLTAVRAADSAVNRDLVALHALLRDVVAQDRVVFAAIKDVDDTLMVQAGEADWPGSTQTFNAPIPLKNNYAGRITVEISEDFSGDQAVRWAVGGTAVLLLVMVALSLYESYGSFWQLVSRPRRALTRSQAPEAVSALAPDETDANDMPDQAHMARCFLSVNPLNAEALSQQLSEQWYEKVSAQYEQHVRDVMQVYGAKRNPNREKGEGDWVFYAPSGEREALFQTLCAAHLLQNLLKDHKIRFKLHMVAATRGHLQTLPREGLFFEAIEISEWLAARLDIEEIESGLFWVRGIKQPYVAELEAQHQQLKAETS